MSGPYVSGTGGRQLLLLPDIIEDYIEADCLSKAYACLRRYKVKSQSSDNYYTVLMTKYGWECNCLDHTERKVKCKHAIAVELSQAIREEVRKNVVIEPVNIDSCIFCHSQDIVKDGIRENKEITIQRFRCKSCRRTFSLNIGFERMKHNPKAITTAMQLYFSGE